MKTYNANKNIFKPQIMIYVKYFLMQTNII